jgi:hypothetical protein
MEKCVETQTKMILAHHLWEPLQIKSVSKVFLLLRYLRGMQGLREATVTF